MGIFLIMHFVFSIGTMTSSDDNFSLIESVTQVWKADLFSKLSHLIFIAFGTSFVFGKSKVIKLLSVLLNCGTYVILILVLDRNLPAVNGNDIHRFFCEILSISTSRHNINNRSNINTNCFHMFI